MGLDIRNEKSGTELFSGAYSAFDRLRKSILESIGGEWGFGRWYWRTDHERSEEYSSVKTPGLYELFNHSDCDGIITWEKAGMLAKELTGIIPLIEEYERNHEAMGHLSRLGIVGTVQKMIDGLEEAYEQKDTVIFG